MFIEPQLLFPNVGKGVSILIPRDRVRGYSSSVGKQQYQEKKSPQRRVSKRLEPKSKKSSGGGMA